MININTTLVIMAAGLGSRYGGLKQIDPVGPNGEIIIDYSINDAIIAGFSEVVFIIRKEDEITFKDTIGRRVENKISTKYVFQSMDVGINVDRKKPWGTGHAVLACKDVVKTSFAAINADDFYGRNSFKILGEFLKNNTTSNLYSMVGFKLLNTLSENGYVSRGICEADSNNSLKNVTEIVKIFKDGNNGKYTLDGENYINLSGNTIVSMNMWGLTPSFFDELENRFKLFLDYNKDDLLTKEFFLPSVVNDLVSENKASVKLLETDDKWYGITYKEDKQNVVDFIHKLVNDGVYSSPL